MPKSVALPSFLAVSRAPGQCSTNKKNLCVKIVAKSRNSIKIRILYNDCRNRKNAHTTLKHYLDKPDYISIFYSYSTSPTMALAGGPPAESSSVLQDAPSSQTAREPRPQTRHARGTIKKLI